MDKEQSPGNSRATDTPRATTQASDPLLPSEIRRRKPPKEAVDAAFERFQSIAAEVDATEERAEAQTGGGETCPSCGQKNRAGNRFCSMCGTTLATSAKQELNEKEVSSAAAGAKREVDANAGPQHHHHHYHYHYFPEGNEGAKRFTPSAPRETDRPTVLPASAAKGEHFSRAETAVRRLTQDWVIGCNTKHLEDVLELYTVDAMIYRSNEPVVRSSSALRGYFVAALEAGLGEIAMEPARVEISGDMAYEAGKFTALMPGVGGKRREERGKYLRVLTKDSEGDWRIAVDCWSSDLTLAEEPARAVPAPPRRG